MSGNRPDTTDKFLKVSAILIEHIRDRHKARQNIECVGIRRIKAVHGCRWLIIDVPEIPVDRRIGTFLRHMRIHDTAAFRCRIKERTALFITFYIRFGVVRFIVRLHHMNSHIFQLFNRCRPRLPGHPVLLSDHLPVGFCQIPDQFLYLRSFLVPGEIFFKIQLVHGRLQICLIQVTAKNLIVVRKNHFRIFLRLGQIDLQHFFQ